MTFFNDHRSRLQRHGFLVPDLIEDQTRDTNSTELFERHNSNHFAPIVKMFFDKPLVEDWGTITAKSGKNNPRTGKCGMGKHQKPQHHHKPVIERTLPLEQIVSLFNRKFDEPYLNPIAELGFDAFTAAFPDISREVLEEALAYWTNHSGQKLLQTKFVEGLEKDPRVWYLHGLSKPSPDFLSSSSSHASTH